MHKFLTTVHYLKPTPEVLPLIPGKFFFLGHKNKTETATMQVGAVAAVCIKKLFACSGEHSTDMWMNVSLL